MQHRRSSRLVAAALVLALPLLGGCGFGKATDKVYTPGAGTNDRDGDVKVLAAVVVAAQPDSGTFIASLSNNGADDDSFAGLSGVDEWSDLEVAEISPAVDLAPRGFVNLADEGGVAITGDFEAGDMMRLSLSFESGQTVTMNVPVVFACDEYTGLDTSAGGGAESGDSESASASPSSDAEAYDCAAALEEE